MRRKMSLTLLAVVLASIPLGAETMPHIVLTNKSDSIIQLTPIDDNHRAPAPLDQISATLPPGAFILINQTSTPINAVVTTWSYLDKDGNAQERKFYCDGFRLVPAANIVRANDSTLITPGGCTMREYFAHKAAGKAMFGGSFYAAQNKSIIDIVDTLTTVLITVDSVIFADGRIWGPDKLQYYRTVSSANWAIRSVAQEVSLARNAGQDISTPLSKIRSETEGKNDEPSFFRNQCARTIQDSPNPEGTLTQFTQQSPLPEFRHIGGDTK